MYRIRASKKGETITLRSGPFTKTINIGDSLAYYVGPIENWSTETNFLFIRKCKELIIDRLAQKHGKAWEKHPMTYLSHDHR